MGLTIETAWNRFRRITVEPYWCKGSPLKWVTPAGVGIAHFAQEGMVGHFNLAWWLLARSEPPQDPSVYHHTSVSWVIFNAANTLVGRWSLTDWASFMTLHEWQDFILAQHKQAYRFSGNGITYADLKRLALIGRN